MMRLLPPSLWLGGSVFPGASRFLASRFLATKHLEGQCVNR